MIGYRSRAFLDQIELTKHGFSKFDQQEVALLLREAGFKQVTTTVIPEPESIMLDGREIALEGLFTEGIK